MAERKHNRNSLRSKKMLRNAFLELLNEKPFDKITITDIVNRAELNRSTFYAHYTDIQALVEEIQSSVFRKEIETFSEMDFGSFLADPLPLLNAVAVVLGDNAELFKKIGQTEALHHQLDEFRQIMVENMQRHNQIPEDIRTSPEFSIRTYFFVGGVMNTYQQWLEGRLNYPLDVVSEDIAKLVSMCSAEWRNSLKIQHCEKDPGIATDPAVRDETRRSET